MGWLVATLLALMPPCQAEDSTYCAWDAQAQGNGLGHSFIAIGESTFYVSD